MLSREIKPTSAHKIAMQRSQVDLAVKCQLKRVYTYFLCKIKCQKSKSFRASRGGGKSPFLHPPLRLQSPTTLQILATPLYGILTSRKNNFSLNQSNYFPLSSRQWSANSETLNRHFNLPSLIPTTLVTFYI